MRKLAILVPVLAFLALAQMASAQQGDIMIGGGTLLSSSPATGVGNFQQPAEKGGAYINISGDVVTFKHRIGFGVETAWRASQGNYPDFEDTTYRPILTDFNGVFQPKITKKIGADLFGGIGVASTRFYVPEVTSCSYFSGCINYSSSDHFMEDLGGGSVTTFGTTSLSAPKFTTTTSRITSSSTPITYSVSAAQSDTPSVTIKPSRHGCSLVLVCWGSRIWGSRILGRPIPAVPSSLAGVAICGCFAGFHQSAG